MAGSHDETPCETDEEEKTPVPRRSETCLWDRHRSGPGWHPDGCFRLTHGGETAHSLVTNRPFSGGSTLPRVKIGLHVARFTFPGGPAALAADLQRIATTADAGGFDRLSVMDHVWQIRVNGPPEPEMLEAYTALGFMAAHTERVNLLTLVTGVVYRSPGLLAKMVSTLDVL